MADTVLTQNHEGIYEGDNGSVRVTNHKSDVFLFVPEPKENDALDSLSSDVLIANALAWWIRESRAKVKTTTSLYGNEKRGPSLLVTAEMPYVNHMA